jgi:hypothetical protein
MPSKIEAEREAVPVTSGSGKAVCRMHGVSADAPATASRANTAIVQRLGNTASAAEQKRYASPNASVVQRRSNPAKVPVVRVASTMGRVSDAN